jgi:uncharacterized protein (DUF2132 family)
MTSYQWNHNNYAVPADRFEELERCLDTLFGWEKLVRRADILGYKLKPNYRQSMVFFRPVEPAGQFVAAIERLRAENPDLDAAIRGLEQLPADFNDHNGIMLESVAEFEARMEHIRRVAEVHPEWQITIVDIYRPGQPNAVSQELVQGFVRIGLLGPIRNTFELQAQIGT